MRAGAGQTVTDAGGSGTNRDRCGWEWVEISHISAGAGQKLVGVG